MPSPSRYRRTRTGAAALFLGLLGLTLAGYSPSSEALRKTSANRECSICHIMWLDEFKRKDVETLVAYDPQPVVETGRQDVASTDRMCFSCHDGFVLDSRDLWKNEGHNHPVGVKPSESIKIPTSEGKTVFPMNADGKLYCGSCHTAHGVDWNEKNTTLFMRVENVESSLCIGCHENRSAKSQSGNHPIRKKLDSLPEDLVAAGSRFGAENEIICQTCHVVHGAAGDKITAVSNRDSGLCANCHGEQARVRQTKHDMTVMSPDSPNALNRKAADSGPCSACHVPHRARGPRLWSRELADNDGDPASASCLGCHREKGIGEKKLIGEHSHPLGVSMDKVGITAGSKSWTSRVRNAAAPDDITPLPLFDNRGKRAAQGGSISCLSCHDPHQWSRDHAQKTAGDVRRLEGDGSNSFLRIANDENSALCINCHRDQAPVGFSRHNLDITAQKETNKDGKTVSESGPCSACHLPHNGTGDRMWARTVEKPGQGIASKCIDCHDEDRVAGKKTTGEYSHPLQVSLEKTGGRTNLPLFDKNGRRGDKQDLVDCATCHDPHQWDPTDALAESGIETGTEGDASNSFLRIRAAGASALCVDCHAKQKPVIGTDHDLSVSAADGMNVQKQTVIRTGVCGQCHTVHNAVTRNRLWAQAPGEGKNAAVTLCTGCHDREGVARAKVPFELEHPPRRLASGEGRLRPLDETRLIPPLADTRGDSGEAGMITCLTCHDPHRWDADSMQNGPGRNTEGDVTTSFLRHRSTEYFLCADCHGEESIFRYKYFHLPKSRPTPDIEKL